MIIFLFSDFKTGGSQKIAIDIFNELIKSKPETIALSISNKGELKKKFKHKKNVLSLGYKKAIYSIFSLFQFLNKKRPNKVFCTQPHLGIILFFLNFFLLKKVKIIVRETNTSKFENFFDISLKKRFENFLKLLIFNYVDCVVFPSKKISYKLKSKNLIIPNFVDISEINKTQSIQKKNFILGMGRLTKQKGFDLLIKSFVKIHKKIKHELIIIGEGQEKNNLIKLIMINKVYNRVRIINFTDKPYSYLKSCSLYVLSSRWEGMPNTLIQALVAKANILSTNCMFGPKQILKNGKLGYLCKVEDVKDMSKKMLIALKFKKKISYNDFNKYDKTKIIKKYIKLFN